ANAIPDLYAVIDGPDCLFRKAEWVYGKHDLSSTLLDVFGNHRIVSTLVNAEAVIKDRGEMVALRIRQVNAIPGARAVVVCAMPHVMLIGTQYDRIIRALEPEVALALIELPSLSLQGDWIDGYAETLAALATNVDLADAAPEPDTVAIIGYLMDRNEADHQANIAELTRLLRGISLDVSSVWLGGSGYDQLSAVKNASTLIALPTGRKAARILAERTGARVVDVETPFGPGRTLRMLRTVARATGRLDNVQPLVDRELRAIVPRLEWVVQHVFQGKRIAFGGAPESFGGMFQIATDLGMEVVFLAASGRRAHLTADLESEFGAMPPLFFAPKSRALIDACERLGPIDLLVGDTHFVNCCQGRVPMLEHGFPSHFSHALFERPSLGYRGWLCFVDRMAQVLMRRPDPNAR
ncbi:MAG: nitrogenase component 1, partial [Deltaproteobacteria bacterium]